MGSSDNSSTTNAPTTPSLPADFSTTPHVVDLSAVPIFNGEHFSSWRFNVKVYMMERDLWGFFDGSASKPTSDASTSEKEAWVRKDKKAFAFLVSQLSLQLVPIVSPCIDRDGATREAWKRLEGEHVSKSLHSKLQARLDFFTVRMRDGESMRVYVNRVEELGERLVELDASVEDNDWIMTLLAGLGEAWSTVITMLDGTQDTWKKEQVVARLINEEARRTKLHGDAIGAAHFSRDAKAKGTARTRDGACRFCKKTGHWWRECPVKPANWKPSSSDDNRRAHVATCDNNDRDFVFVASGTTVGGVDAWILDTGATQHMTACATLLNNVTTEAPVKRVMFGNRDTLDVTGQGDLRLMVDGGPLTIKNVLVVPGLGANLLSVSQLTRKGMRVNIEGTMMALSAADGVHIGTARQTGGLFMLDALPSVASAQAATSATSLSTWHNRLGHLHHAAIQAMHWWGEAVTLATWIRNRCVTKALPNKTPLEAWSGTKPDVTDLRTFGCTCYYHVPDATRTKLEAKARVAMYLGPSADHKGWRVWDLEHGKLVVSRDVVFYEDTFPSKSTTVPSVIIVPPPLDAADEADDAPTAPPPSASEGENGAGAVGVSEDEGNAKERDPSSPPPRITPTLASTRTRRNPHPNSKFDDYSLVAGDDVGGGDAMCLEAYTDTPSTYHGAMSSAEAAEWERALQEDTHSCLPVSPSRLSIFPSRSPLPLHAFPFPLLATPISVPASPFPLPALNFPFPPPRFPVLFPFPRPAPCFPFLHPRFPFPLPFSPSCSPFPLPTFRFPLPALHYSSPPPHSCSSLLFSPPCSLFHLPASPTFLLAPHFPFPPPAPRFTFPPSRFTVSFPPILTLFSPHAPHHFPPFSLSFPSHSPVHFPPFSLSLPRVLPLISPLSASHSPPPCSLSSPPLLLSVSPPSSSRFPPFFLSFPPLILLIAPLSPSQFHPFSPSFPPCSPSFPPYSPSHFPPYSLSCPPYSSSFPPFSRSFRRLSRGRASRNAASPSRTGSTQCITLSLPALPFPSLHYPSPPCITLPLLALPFPSLHYPSPPCITLPLPALPFPSLHYPSPPSFPSLHYPSPPCITLPLPALPFPSLHYPSPPSITLPLH
ncbi:unnamed protein product [Closterium sp. Yama58-4]|nr:unnamed protein product [Closterium sp. Yama58-4]